MTSTIQLDTARIAALLNRLDAHQGEECHVAGCVHDADPGHGRGDPGPGSPLRAVAVSGTRPPGGQRSPPGRRRR